MVGFEAAVAGGIPIIKAMREGLAGNRIEWVAGIINGTANFILSEMRDKGRDRSRRCWPRRRRCGYAEADPTFDIEGIDAAHKLDDHVRHRLRRADAVREGVHGGHHAS
jgi:homoserine dehydrogenase